MNNIFTEKTTVYLKKAKQYEDEGNYQNAIVVVDEAIQYMDEFAKKVTDNNWKLYYFDNYRNIWRLYRFSLETRSDLEIYKQETNVALDKLSERLNQLEGKER